MRLFLPDCIGSPSSCPKLGYDEAQTGVASLRATLPGALSSAECCIPSGDPLPWRFGLRRMVGPGLRRMVGPTFRRHRGPWPPARIGCCIPSGDPPASARRLEVLHPFGRPASSGPPSVIPLRRRSFGVGRPSRGGFWLALVADFGLRARCPGALAPSRPAVVQPRTWPRTVLPVCNPGRSEHCMHAEAGEPGGVNNPSAVSSASPARVLHPFGRPSRAGLGHVRRPRPALLLLRQSCRGGGRATCAASVQRTLTGKGPSLRSWAPGE